MIEFRLLLSAFIVSVVFNTMLEALPLRSFGRYNQEHNSYDPRPQDYPGISENIREYRRWLPESARYPTPVDWRLARYREMASGYRPKEIPSRMLELYDQSRNQDDLYNTGEQLDDFRNERSEPMSRDDYLRMYQALAQMREGDYRDDGYIQQPVDDIDDELLEKLFQGEMIEPANQEQEYFDTDVDDVSDTLRLDQNVDRENGVIHSKPALSIEKAKVLLEQLKDAEKRLGDTDRKQLTKEEVNAILGEDMNENGGAEHLTIDTGNGGNKYQDENVSEAVSHPETELAVDGESSEREEIILLKQEIELLIKALEYAVSNAADQSNSKLRLNAIYDLIDEATSKQDIVNYIERRITS